MKRFLVLYYAPVSAREQMAGATPEQAKAGMEAWMTWAKKAGNAIVDLGAPLGNGRSLKGASVSNNNVGVVGYSLLQADSIETMTNVLRDHPHLRMPNFSIEVFESLPIPGM
jgi:hypothetical protein